MNEKQFSWIRYYLGKTQSQLAELLLTSLRSVQSYEQGWRNITPQVERQLLFLVSLKTASSKKENPCWELTNCPMDRRNKCSTFEFNAGRFCWYITGTLCHGEHFVNWESKLEQCEKCEVFLVQFPFMSDITHMGDK